MNKHIHVVILETQEIKVNNCEEPTYIYYSQNSQIECVVTKIEKNINL